SARKRLVSLITLALNLDENFFEKVGDLNGHFCNSSPFAPSRIGEFRCWIVGDLMSISIGDAELMASPVMFYA
ncbi:hypothetical protein ABKV19_005788, partial [Rosa sericea]